MPCSRRLSAALQEMETSDDGVKMYTWRAIRRQHLRMLRQQTRAIVLFMALIEIARVGVVDLVYAGKHATRAPGPDDYGIAYTVGYLIGWLYLCAFAVVYVPFFSWWIPELFSSSNDDDAPAERAKTGKVIAFLQKVNMCLLPACVGLALIKYVCSVISTLVHVGAKPVDPSAKSPRHLNSRHHWLVRLLLLGGIMTSVMVGKGVFVVLEATDLARVKPLEYLLIVLPIQINLGILLGSAVQFKAEQRRNRKLATRKVEDAEAATSDEKQRLLA